MKLRKVFWTDTRIYKAIEAVVVAIFCAGLFCFGYFMGG